jgi:hypothetical protein
MLRHTDTARSRDALEPNRRSAATPRPCVEAGRSAISA